MPAKNWWNVSFETRQQGAIGLFGVTMFKVRADKPSEAVEYALETAHIDGFETRWPTIIIGPCFEADLREGSSR